MDIFGELVHIFGKLVHMFAWKLVSRTSKQVYYGNRGFTMILSQKGQHLPASEVYKNQSAT